MFIARYHHPLESHFQAEEQRLPAAAAAFRASRTTQKQIHDSDAQVTMSLDLPGVRPGDVNVTVENHVLKIEATRTFPATGSTSEFSKHFSLNETIDADNIQANLIDGVLTITAPKIPKSGPNHITVTTNPSEQAEATPVLDDKKMAKGEVEDDEAIIVEPPADD